jgi:putative acyl-CoA dehydrogenase
MARIYREMPLNSIWEGAGNIMALDLRRAVRRRGARDVELLDVLDGELAPLRRASPICERHTAALWRDLSEAADGAGDESGARRLAQDLALALQAAQLHRHAPEFVFDAFCRSRLAGGGAGVFGSLPAGLALQAIVERAMPH